MAEDTVEASGEDETPIPSIAESPGYDPLLQLLVKVVEDSDAGVNGMTPFHFDVTISVGGMLISGELVGAKTYFEAVQTFAEGLGETTGSFFKTLTEPALEAVRERDNSTHSPRYIHLVRAAFLLDHAAPIAPGVPWRGRLSSVDGFFFGQLATVPSKAKA